MQCPSNDCFDSNEGRMLVLKLGDDDPHFSKKKKLLQSKNLDVEIRIGLQDTPSPDWIKNTTKAMLQMSRIMHMDEAELYFFEDDTCPAMGYYTPKNELEALNSVISLIDSSLSGSTSLAKDALQALRNAVIDLLQQFVPKNEMETLVVKSHTCVKENNLTQWATSNGMKTKLQIAYIEGFGRGATAKEDLNVGDVALEIPLSAIISEDIVRESNMYPTLQKIDGISTETMLLIWSMKERHNHSSKFKMYFDTLPEEFNTGLSFGVNAIMALDGTLLLEELMQAKEHLRTQYDELFPVLCNEHAEMFPPELYTWEQFLWACELWYSNSMKIQFADGELRTCLIPVAGFLNHSIYPHITRYGKVDLATSTLKFPMSRPCRAGEQCYLSYGSLSSSHLITFYGFLPKGENPYDVIPLDIDDGCNESIWTNHMVRGTWFSSKHTLFHYGLPYPLLHCLRRAQDFSLDDSSPEKLENEMQLLTDLSSTFSAMIENLGDIDLDSGEDVEWDVKLALQFKNLQKRIISSIIGSCNTGLKMLQDELCRID